MGKGKKESSGNSQSISELKEKGVLSTSLIEMVGKEVSIIGFTSDDYTDSEGKERNRLLIDIVEKDTGEQLKCFTGSKTLKESLFDLITLAIANKKMKPLDECPLDVIFTKEGKSFGFKDWEK